MSFADHTQLATFVRRTFSSEEDAQADLFLKFATAAIVAEIGQSIVKATTTANLEGTWSRDLELPERPVLAVTSVTLNGRLMDSSEWTWNGGNIIRRGAPFGSSDWGDWWSEPDYELATEGRPLQGAVGDEGLSWGGPTSRLEVVYQHGYDPVPDLLVGVCLAAAARCMENPIAVRQEMLGAYQVSYESGGGTIELTDDETRRIRRVYRKRSHRV